MTLGSGLGSDTLKEAEKVAIPEAEKNAEQLIAYLLKQLQSKRIVISIEDKP